MLLEEARKLANLNTSKTRAPITMGSSWLLTHHFVLFLHRGIRCHNSTGRVSSLLNVCSRLVAQYAEYPAVNFDRCLTSVATVQLSH